MFLSICLFEIIFSEIFLYENFTKCDICCTMHMSKQDLLCFQKERERDKERERGGEEEGESVSEGNG